MSTTGSGLKPVSECARALNVNPRTVERYLEWATASELSVFDGYRRAAQLNFEQQQALHVIRKCRQMRLPDYEVSRRVEAAQSPTVNVLAVEEWLRSQLPGDQGVHLAKLFRAEFYENSEAGE